MSDKAELDRIWSALDKTNQYVEGLEKRMVFRVAPIGDVKFTHDCHGRKLPIEQLCSWQPPRVSCDEPVQLAPAPDYTLASEDAGDFHEPTIPGVLQAHPVRASDWLMELALDDGLIHPMPPERCSCEETETLRGLLRHAREHVPSAQSDWHERVADALRG